jgi:transcription initiation factor TFIID subunit 6
MWTMMRLVRSILYNSDLFVEPYVILRFFLINSSQLHHLVPNILTCLVAKKLSDTQITSANECRAYAGQLISHICHTYGDAYPTLVPRVTKTLLRAFLDPAKSLGCRYGSIIGLQGLGPLISKKVVIPNIKAFGEEMKGYIQKDENTKEAELCIHAVESLVKSLLMHEVNNRDSSKTPMSVLDELYKEVGPQLGIFEKVFSNAMNEQQYQE